MEPQVIPGYFYDAEKKRYFKIEKHDIPAFITQSTVNSHSASEQSVSLVQNLNKSIKPPEFSSLLPLISAYERLHCPVVGRRLVRDYGRSQIYHFKQQSTVDIEPLSHCLLSPSGSHLHGSSHSLFASYKLFWSHTADVPGQRKQRQKRQTLERVGKMHVRKGPTTCCTGYLVLDLAWRRPGKEMLALCDLLGEISLVSVTFQDSRSGFHHLFDPTNSVRLPHGGSAQFPTRVATSEEFTEFFEEHSDDFVHAGGTALIWTRSGIYRFEENNYRPLYVLCDKRHIKRPPKVSITACAHSSLHPLRTDVVELFVASSSIHGDRRLCLIQLDSHRPAHRNTLITFGSSTVLFDSDVTFVQSLNNPAGYRIGLLTRSLSGLLQLWDDRWPREPVLFYRGSDCGSLYKLASHIRPQPVVDLSSPLQCVACPLPASATVAVWDVWSGCPVRVLELDRSQDRAPSAPPPIVFLRSSWPSISGEVSRGPGMCVVDRDAIHWVFAT